MATIKGKWVFNETPDLTSVPYFADKISVNFTSNNISFSAIYKRNSMDGFAQILMYWEDYGHDAYANGNDADASEGWTYQAYRTVDFGTTDQTVTDDFLTWMQANATPEAEPAPTDAVTIEYNGAVIASLNAGQTATLPCKDTLMHTDVVVSVPEGMGAGEVVEEWDGSYTIADAVSLISFYIDGDEYQAESGMTWVEWVASDYNTGGYERFVVSAVETVGLFDTALSSRAVAYNDSIVSLNDAIVADREYQHKTVTTGGGA